MELNLFRFFEGHCLLFPAADDTKRTLDTNRKDLYKFDHETPHNFVQEFEQLFDIARATVALTVKFIKSN
jgi:predicted transcriptional regulator